LCHYSKYFFVFGQLSTCAFCRLAYNVPAALRGGGFHYTCCGAVTFNFPQNCLRGYCRHLAKPPVRCCAFYELSFSSSLQQSSNLSIYFFIISVFCSIVPLRNFCNSSPSALHPQNIVFSPFWWS